MKFFDLNADGGKEAFTEYLLKRVAAQAIMQHQELCYAQGKSWEHGRIFKYWRDVERGDVDEVPFVVQYEDGTIFEYKDLDGGAEGMIVKQR